MSERKHADLWNELVDEAGEAEIERAASVSVEQAEAELAAAGFDVAAERAKANAFLEALERGDAAATPTATPTPTQKRRTRPRDVVVRLAGVAASAAAGAALYAGLQQPLGLTGNPSRGGPTTSAPSEADLALAADLRRQAAAACDAKQWSVCLADLDKARAVDPGGDEAPAVKALRDRAIAAILSPAPRRE